ncbi:MAG: hypothetical protein AAGE43_08475 [Pseudomonadota bacterium]
MSAETVVVEISMYPTRDAFIPAVDDFLEALNAVPEMEVQTNAVSTLVYGPYDHVLDTLKRLMWEADPSGIFVMKIKPRADREIGRYGLTGAVKE